MDLYIPYICIYSVAAGSFVAGYYNVKKHQTRIIMLFLAILFTLFRGLRWETGTDWVQFLDVFNEASFSNIFSFSRGGSDILLEPGFVFINSIFQQYTHSYTAFLLFYNAVILLIFYKISWEYAPKNPVCIFVILLLFDLIFPLRNSWALSLFLLSVKYIQSREFIKYSLIILLAASIHITVLYLLPFYFLLNKVYPTKLLIGIYILCAFIACSPIINLIVEGFTVLIAPIVGVDSDFIMKVIYYSTYDRGIEVTWISFFASMARGFLFAYLFYIFKERFKDNPYYNIYYNCFFVSLFMVILFKFQFQEFIRMAAYFYYGTFILQGFILTKLKKTNRIIFYSVLILYSGYTIWYQINLFPNAFLPYKSVF